MLTITAAKSKFAVVWSWLILVEKVAVVNHMRTTVMRLAVLLMREAFWDGETIQRDESNQLRTSKRCDNKRLLQNTRYLERNR